MKRVLPFIVLSQLLCTSLWFAVNPVMADIVNQFQLGANVLAHLTSAVQFGFIGGTFIFALLAISDKVSPSRVFFLSALLASFSNLSISFGLTSSLSLFLSRFATGFFLAGIYPVGMKIASDYYQKQLSKSLGFLVGALVLGTAFPHLLKTITATLDWKLVIYSTSAFSLLGGLIILIFVPDGPHRSKAQPLRFKQFIEAFKRTNFRAATLGYFGHMWELYAFWTFVPVILTTFNQFHPEQQLPVALCSFLIIGLGSIACVISGFLSQSYPPKKVATLCLVLSGFCCIISPFVLYYASAGLLLFYLIFWGLVVIADSPLFSTIVAHEAPEASRGTSLTIVNCIGFAITIISIQLMNILLDSSHSQFSYVLLAIGPALGIMSLQHKSTAINAKAR